ncbi:MAG: DnaT-like ssDNA-binding domain-containing protein [Pseudohongiellaceae bacterium]
MLSPTLAATIGVEEAIMLQALADVMALRATVRRSSRPDLDWVAISDQDLAQLFPFWESVDLRRIMASLKSLGLIAIDPDPALHSRNFIAIDEVSEAVPGAPVADARPVAPESAPAGHASLIPLHWLPDDNWVRMCKQHNIPEQFIRDLVPEFVSYWRERGQARFSWGNAFYKHVLREWRKEETRRGAHELASTMSADWRPNPDAVEILVNSGISAEFVEDAIAEFVLYWRERGVVHGAWNTKFIEHIRRQWAKFSASFGRDDVPRPIPEDWQPSSDCYEILQLAEIDDDYARSRVPEFVMYWRDSGQARASWNTVFLQFIKQDWARRLKASTEEIYAEDQAAVGSSQERIKEKFQRIADRSWAE